ncbi:CPK26 [Symbiodinium natans]|uniref:CPK26 protein n=1 Tax=Symbiodinium natans TaxID=878477 RepID=A0A812LGC1_9DINO|nr:CPK26 [Symbiodinium natans]
MQSLLGKILGCIAEAVKKLGEGGYGKVFKCKVLCGSAEDYVTVKLVAEKSDDVLREIELMEEMSGVSEFCLSSLGSPTIPSFVDAPEGYWIMMPLMNGGELYELMTSCDRHLGCGACEDWFGRRCWTDLNPSYTTAFMLSLFRDAVKGVAAFHAQTGFLHADLKPENVMLNCRGTDDCFAAVIDFGLACDMKDPEECAYAGTPAYVPPEVYLSSPVAALGSPKRDVWALGVILYELTYQSVPPFAMEDGSGDLVTAYDPATDNNFPQPPTALDQLIIQMLALNYTERPTLNSIETMLKDIILEELKAEDERDERKVLAMLDETPTERGASVAKPKCLSQSDAAQVLEANPELKAGKQHHRRSSASGSEEAKREHCTDTPRPFANIRKCGMKRQGKRRVCCVCHVERGGKIVNAHFPMMDECL